jgi:hypothetical protein
MRPERPGHYRSPLYRLDICVTFDRRVGGNDADPRFGSDRVVNSTALRPPGPIDADDVDADLFADLGQSQADAVLHATTSILIPSDAKNWEFSMA